MHMCEVNVINWAVALIRAEQPKNRKHAARMLTFAVERLGDG